MGFGLFGKLPQKRDFVSVGLPHAILHPWETWLQQAVAASRSDIGRGWEEWYLVAPIWHFWLGKDVFGANCAGSLMASVDQVGRYFPLTIMYVADGKEQLPPPLLDGMTEWYHQIDERLLAVLAEEREIEIGAVVAGLQPPRPGAPQPIAIGIPASLGPKAPGSPGPLIETPSAVAAAAAANGKASPAGESAKAAPWDDLPKMKTDILSVLRQTTGAEVEPPHDPTIPPTPLPSTAATEDTEAASASPWDAPEGAAPADAPAEPEAAAPAKVEAEDSAAAAAPAPAVEAPVRSEPSPSEPQQLPPARIQSGEFKGGILLAVEPHRRIAEAAGDMIDRDYRQAAMARSYWWCETTPTGSPLMHSRQGLPDPYFFTRMLMWVKQ